MKFLKAMIDQKPFLMSAALVGALGSIILCCIHLSLVADDFNYLSRVYSEAGLQLKDLYPFISRVPLTVILTKFYFYLPGAEGVAVPAVLTFLIYCFSTARIFSYFTTEARLSITPCLAFWATSVLLLYPTHYEILYWITAMPYIFGLALWALSLGAVVGLQITLLAAAFLVSEMYVLPVLILPHLISLIKGELTLEKAKPDLIKWFAAMVIFFVVRLAIRIGLDLPSFAYVVSFSAPFVLGRIRDAFFGVYSIHFFKVYWLNTVIYWLALVSLLAILLKNHLISLNKFSAIFALSFLTTGIYWIFDRNAPRALFGAQIVICLVVFYLVTLVEFKVAKKFLAVFFLVFALATAKIFFVKAKNYRVLKGLETEWVDKLSKCPNPCEFEVKNLDKDIRGDWVLPEGAWPDFIRFIKNKYKINQELKPVFTQTQN